MRNADRSASLDAALPPDTDPVPASRLDRIVLATGELLEALPLREVTTTRIAERAEVAISTLYRFFPDRVKHTVMLQFPGGGVSVQVIGHLSAFADFRFMFQSRRGEPDAGGFAPVRGGLAWRF